MLVRPVGSQHPVDLAGDDLGLLNRFGGAAVVTHRQPTQPGAELRRLLREFRGSPTAVVDRSEMNRHTSGCMRRVTSKNAPRSAGMVASSPRTCSSTLAPLPPGWEA
ncbi:MAG: hypothetical protein IPH38_09045 [Candidatus Microthrix sp.]|nr:hypothetical protein [Candidatus Microthrix sp.]